MGAYHLHIRKLSGRDRNNTTKQRGTSKNTQLTEGENAMKSSTTGIQSGCHSGFVPPVEREIKRTRAARACVMLRFLRFTSTNGEDEESVVIAWLGDGDVRSVGAWWWCAFGCLAKLCHSCSSETLFSSSVVEGVSRLLIDICLVFFFGCGFDLVNSRIEERGDPGRRRVLYSCIQTSSKEGQFIRE